MEPRMEIFMHRIVRLLLTTHSKGGLTELDFALAERIDLPMLWTAQEQAAGIS